MQQTTASDRSDATALTIAIVDQDRQCSAPLELCLQQQGALVDVFGDSNDLLAHHDPYGYEFYVLDLALPGVDGIELIKVLRRRTDAGVLVVSSRQAPEAFGQSLDAGADMYLAKPAAADQVVQAMHAVQRRIHAATAALTIWRLDQRARQLIAPDGVHIPLSESDLALMECFLAAAGGVVTRQTLSRRLGRDSESDEGLNATVYRLRRRIERATPALVPLQSRSRVGYVFKAPLKAA